MLETPYQDTFTYKGIGDVGSVYGLTVLTETSGDVIVIITELEENTGISITSCYERIATQIYHQHLSEIPINNIIWVERIIHQNNEPENNEAFFQVDLIWNEESKCYNSPQWQPCDQKILKNKKMLHSECVD